MEQANPIHRMLDAIGVPWRLTRAELEERFGVHSDPAYLWDIITIETQRPFVEGLIRPLSVQAFEQFSPLVPASDFNGVVSLGSDARENLRRTSHELVRRLGDATASNSSNTIGWKWSFGAARLRATVWPPDMQHFPMTNPSHERDPRLITGCHLWIETGWRPALTAEEAEWLTSFVPVSDILVRPAFQPNEPPTQSELEFVREPEIGINHLIGHLGLSADGNALAFCHKQLFLVRMSDVVSFQVERLKRGRGPGGSKLYVECRTHYERYPTKRLLIHASDEVEGLNALASELSQICRKPFELSPYYLDD
jgi:hypothetical protein